MEIPTISLTQLEEKKMRVGARRGLVLANCLAAEGHSVLRHGIQGEQAKSVHSKGCQSSVHHVGPLQSGFTGPRRQRPHQICLLTVPARDRTQI